MIPSHVIRYGSWMPPAGWMVVVYFLLTTEVDPESVAWLPEHSDKVVHFVLFAVLAWLLLLPFVLGLAWPVMKAAVIGFLLAALYGAWMEYLQTMLPYRHANIGDVIANILGAATVFAAARVAPLLHRYTPQR
jgi:VanZ family protein